jgi:hypothetical protein
MDEKWMDDKKIIQIMNEKFYTRMKNEKMKIIIMMWQVLINANLEYLSNLFPNLSNL